MKVLLTTLNAKFIHKNLALRYLYRTAPEYHEAIIREFTIKDSLENIVDSILEINPDVIGFSTYIWNVEQIKEICHLIKKQRDDIKILLGGPEVSFEKEYFLNNFEIDALCCGEGEISFWKYVDHANHASFDIPGIFTRTIKPSVEYAIVDLREVEKYEDPYFIEFDQKDMGNRYLYVETSRGCPYQCSYCLSSVLGKVRLFSIEYVKGVLDKIFASNVKQIKFLDRTFNVDKNRALEIAKYIDENAKKDQVFQFEIMAEHLSEELIEYLSNRQEYPKLRFEIGIQTTNTDSLKEINRYQNFEKLGEVIQRIGRNNNCEMHVDLIAGLPNEDLESFKKSFNDVFYLHANELQLGFLKLLRGTKMKQKKDDYGMQYDNHAPYEISETKWMSGADLKVIHTACYALDNIYNKPRMRKCIDYIVDEYKIKPFDLLYTLGLDLYANKFNQVDLIFKSVIKTVKENYKISNIEGLLNEEYYCLFKQKTKRICDFELDDDERNSLIDLLFEYGIGSKNNLMNYGIFANGYDGLLFVLYNNKQTYPNIYKIKGKKIEVLK